MAENKTRLRLSDTAKSRRKESVLGFDKETIEIGSAADDVDEPFPDSGLDALVLTAASDVPDSILFSDDHGSTTAAVAARRVRHAAALFREAGLVAGERVLIVAGAEGNAIIALAATLRVGLEPALVPVGLNPVELAARAQAANAVAVVGPSLYGDLSLGETYLSTAAIVDTLRMVATQGPEPVDGAVDLSSSVLDAMAALDETDGDRMTETRVIGTFQGTPHEPVLILHRQAALFADALSLVELARINPTKRLVSTLPPATMAGLVAGPFAALVGASSLTLHGPFDARRLLVALDGEAGSHLVTPCAMGAAFEDRQLSAALSSLVLVSRFTGDHDFALPSPFACDRPMVDLYAFGEDTLLARRRTDGEARPPARITDKSLAGGLGARLNRARADHDMRS